MDDQGFALVAIVPAVAALAVCAVLVVLAGARRRAARSGTERGGPLAILAAVLAVWRPSLTIKAAIDRMERIEGAVKGPRE